MTTPTQALNVLAAARPDQLAAPEQYIRDRIYQGGRSPPRRCPRRTDRHFVDLLSFLRWAQPPLPAILLVALAVQPQSTAAPTRPHVARPVQSDSLRARSSLGCSSQRGRRDVRAREVVDNRLLGDAGL